MAVLGSDAFPVRKLAFTYKGKLPFWHSSLIIHHLIVAF